jgi:hypothetical protein
VLVVRITRQIKLDNHIQNTEKVELIFAVGKALSHVLDELLDDSRFISIEGPIKHGCNLLYYICDLVLMSESLEKVKEALSKELQVIIAGPGEIILSFLELNFFLHFVTSALLNGGLVLDLL